MPLNGYDRVLTWSDYTEQASGRGNSKMDAESFLAMQPVYKWVRKGKALVITEATVNIILVKARSWVVKKALEDNGSDELLRHEQGHYDTMALCARQMYRSLQALSAPDENALKEKVNNLQKESLKKFFDVSAWYDKETDHGRNQEEQEKWNRLIAEEKKKTNGSVDNLPRKPK